MRSCKLFPNYWYLLDLFFFKLVFFSGLFFIRACLFIKIVFFRFVFWSFFFQTVFSQTSFFLGFFFQTSPCFFLRVVFLNLVFYFWTYVSKFEKNKLEKENKSGRNKFEKKEAQKNTSLRKNKFKKKSKRNKSKKIQGCKKRVGNFSHHVKILAEMNFAPNCHRRRFGGADLLSTPCGTESFTPNRSRQNELLPFLPCITIVDRCGTWRSMEWTLWPI